MMNANRIALILAAVLMLLALAVPVIGEPQDGIIVEGADVILTPPVSEALPPADVETRVVVAYANELLRMDLDAMAVPPSVPQRVVAAYANAILREPLAVAPEFPVPERIIFAFANTNLHFALDFPLEFIDDSTPPVISDVAAEISSSTTVTITWTTDEFADSAVPCREETGQYPAEPESDPSFVKDHELVLTELTPDITYYYYVCSTDQSGNAACGSEHSFKVSTDRYVYLPLIRRDSP